MKKTFVAIAALCLAAASAFAASPGAVDPPVMAAKQIELQAAPQAVQAVAAGKTELSTVAVATSAAPAVHQVQAGVAGRSHAAGACFECDGLVVADINPISLTPDRWRG